METPTSWFLHFEGRDACFCATMRTSTGAENPCVARVADRCGGLFLWPLRRASKMGSISTRDTLPIVEHDETISDGQTISDVAGPTQLSLDSMIVEELGDDQDGRLSGDRFCARTGKRTCSAPFERRARAQRVRVLLAR